MAVSGSTLVVGARIDGYPSPAIPGALFVYSRTNGAWSLQQKLTVADDPAVHFLGPAVAIDGNTIVGGIPQAVVNGVVSGAAYVFEIVPRPLATPDSYAIPVNVSLVVNPPGLLANDLNGTLTTAKVSDPAHGSVIVNSMGSFLYTPNAAFTGVDSVRAVSASVFVLTE